MQPLASWRISYDDESDSSHSVMRQDASDEELICRVAEGDQASYRLLVERYMPKAYAVAYRVLFNKNEAEDVLQEIWTKVWVHAASWDRNRAKFSTWFYRMLVNACIDSRRRKRMYPIDAAMDVIDTSASVEDQAAGKQATQHVKQALDSLPDRQKLALTLCYYEGFTNEQAAEMMGVHIKALEGLMVRARKTLRERLAFLGES